MSKGTERRQEMSQKEYGEMFERAFGGTVVFVEEGDVTNTVMEIRPKAFGKLVEGKPVAASGATTRPRPTSDPRVRERE